jgi:hypothetical protein
MKALTVIFSHEDKIFLHGTIFKTPDGTAKRIGAAGSRPVRVNCAALVGNEDTAGSPVIHHGQIKPGKRFAGVLFHDDIAVEQLPRGETRCHSQPQDIVWCQGELEHPAAVGETLDTSVTAKGKSVRLS